MVNDRIGAAIARIEHALDRIDHAPAPSIVQDGMAAPRREQAAEALRSLDSLISELRTAQEGSNGHG